MCRDGAKPLVGTRMEEKVDQRRAIGEWLDLNFLKADKLTNEWMHRLV